MDTSEAKLSLWRFAILLLGALSQQTAFAQSGMTQHSFSATIIAARSSADSASSLRDKTIDGRVCPPSSALPEL